MSTAQAGPKALKEIRDAVSDLLNAIDTKADTLDTDHPMEHTEYVAELLADFFGDYQGSYYYSGANGWKYALEHPNKDAFDKANW